jgi:hypothetical protein
MRNIAYRIPAFCKQQNFDGPAARGGSEIDSRTGKEFDLRTSTSKKLPQQAGRERRQRIFRRAAALARFL